MAAEMTSALTIGTHAGRLAAAHQPGRRWKESDTGLIYADDGAAWQIEKGEGHVRKTADETVNNSAALQNDDHLFFPVEPNEVWYVEVFALINCVTATPHWKAGLYWPTGATVRQWAASNDTNGTTNPNTAVGSTFNFATIAGDTACRIVAWVAVAGTGGNVGVQWAQNTATVENTKVLTNSQARMRRLA